MFCVNSILFITPERRFSIAIRTEVAFLPQEGNTILILTVHRIQSATVEDIVEFLGKPMDYNGREEPFERTDDDVILAPLSVDYM